MYLFLISSLVILYIYVMSAKCVTSPKYALLVFEHCSGAIAKVYFFLQDWCEPP